MIEGKSPMKATLRQGRPAKGSEAAILAKVIGYYGLLGAAAVSTIFLR
jgi:hypothetical protein